MMSVRQTGVPLGGLLAAIALPPIAVHFGWRLALAFAAGSAVVGAGLCAVLYRLAGSPREAGGLPAA